MPYIEEKLRDEVRRQYATAGTVDDAGALAFIVCDAIEAFLPRDAKWADRALAIGTVEGALHEAKRQLLDRYEDGKRHQHGDVFTRHDTGT